MKSINVKINPSAISADACEDAGVTYPASGNVLLYEDGSVTFANGVPVNNGAAKAARQVAGFRFFENNHPSGLSFLGSEVDNSHLFE